jgi:hypothetical protein
MRLELALAVTTVAVTLSGAARAADAPSLGGDWTLNRELSQDLAAKIVAVTGGDQAKSDPDLGRARDELLELARRGDTLEIELGKDQVQMAYANDDVRIFYPGREHTRERAGLGKIRALSRWEGGSLVIEQALAGGAKSVETYSLIDDGRRMAVMLKLEAKRLREPLTARIVYDRDETPPMP